MEEEHLIDIFVNSLKKEMKEIIKMKEPIGLRKQIEAVIKMEASEFRNLFHP